MKKILALTALSMLFAAPAFAAALATHVPTDAGLGIYGGRTAAEATAATNPIVKLSTGVRGIINFDTANPISYAISTKHDKGSKIFGTGNDSTSIWWKASPAGALVAADVGAASDNDNFEGVAGWTSY